MGVCSIYTFTFLVDYGTETFLKRLAGKTGVEDALARLDTLTKEEGLLAMARSLEATLRAERLLLPHSVPVHRHGLEIPTGTQMRESVRRRLKPPSPSVNHKAAQAALRKGSESWFIRDSRFDEWKKTGSFLWICGNRADFLPYRPLVTAN